VSISDGILGLDVHVSGFHVAVAFGGKLWLYNLLMDGLSPRASRKWKSVICAPSATGGILVAEQNISTILFFSALYRWDCRHRMQDSIGRSLLSVNHQIAGLSPHVYQTWRCICSVLTEIIH
jgi:hypothetical protein